MGLDLPPPDTRRLAAAPLDVVVCQLQYDRSLVISDNRVARDLHERLEGRHGPYPNVDQVQMQGLNVDVGQGAPTAMAMAPATGWRFRSEDGAWVVSVLPEHVSLETTAYSTWDDFRRQLQTVLAAVKDMLDPAFEQRLGLRYIDKLIEKNVAQPEDWKTLLSPTLLGPVLHSGFGSAIQVAQQHLVLSLDPDSKIQCGFRHGFVSEPDQDPSYVLDFDVYREGGRPFDLDDAMQTVDSFNEYALQLFQASLQQDYREQLV